MSGKSYTERARALRPYIEQASESLPDSDAAKAVEMFPRWADHIGETVKPGDRRSDTDESGVLHVYRVNKGQGHTTQENWPPHSTPAMWTIINVDHAGTQDDPIPAARGMEYTYGLYYKDPEDTKLYLCERTGEAAGGKIVLQYLPFHGGERMTAALISAAAAVVVALIEAIAARDRRRDKKEREKAAEQQKMQEQLMLKLIEGSWAAIALGEATAKAMQRIPDAHCNGDMHAALDYAAEVKHKQKEFLAERGIHSILDNGAAA